MDKTSNKFNEIILDVFEIIDYTNPILKYKISVVDKFIILVSNKDVPSTDTGFVVHDDKIREKLVLYDLTDNEKFDFDSYLTHKFQIRHFSKNYLFLNLTDKDLIKLGFKEKPPVIKFKLNENKKWFIGLSVMASIGIVAIILNNSKGSKTSDIKDTNQIRQEEKIKPSVNQSEFSQSDSLNVPVDSTNILKTEKLNEK